MNKIKGWLDHLPAVARHAIIVFVGVLGGTIVQAIIDKHGVTQVAWGPTATNAIDSAFYATATIMAALIFTPLTRQYGIGKQIQ